VKWLPALSLLLYVATARAQPPASPPPPSQTPQSSTQSAGSPDQLPNAPGEPPVENNVVAIAETAWKATGRSYEPCSITRAMRIASLGTSKADKNKVEQEVQQPCNELFNPYQRFLATNVPIPLTPKQKGMLALHNLTDAANLATIVAVSGFTIAIDSHTAYGPGIGGFGLNVGVSLLQDATGEFFGTFAIPSLVHEDPHYHRMPHGTVPRRLLHAVSRTVIAQSDYGNNMPNYATLLTYPISAEISNLYVPGIESNARSTVVRVFTGYALDPVGNLVAEFLPDVASRVHIRIIIVQRILNQISSTQGGTSVTSP
jgi:hypothetical protein